MMRVLSAWLCCMTAIASASDLVPELIRLARVRHAMAQNLTRLPNYTCLRTIHRSVRATRKGKYRESDTVRLEVALVNGKELFAWPGSGRFLDTDVRNMVASGAIGTGDFAGFARALFHTNSAQFRYAGEEEYKGRRSYKWDYTVPQMLSGYTLRVSQVEAIVGFHGSIWADAETLDLRALEVVADDIPPVLMLDSTRGRIEYERTTIGTGSFLLPASAFVQMEGLDGGANLNETTFGSCHQYTGESVLIFDEPAQIAEKPSTGPARELVAPDGIRMDVKLETPVRDDVAIGDEVRFVLDRPAKIGSGLAAPKGAVLRARVSYKGKRRYERFAGYLLGLQASSLEWENTRVSLRARIESVTSVMPPILIAWGAQVAQQERLNERIMGSIFFVRTVSPLHLRRGLVMTWRTTAPDAEGGQ